MKNNNSAEKEISLTMLKKRLGKYRYEHTIRVLKAALELAEIYNAEIEKVRKAAVLHDIAKNLEKNKLKKIIKKSNWKIDCLEWSLDSVLHAPAGAEIAKKEFGIDDYDILEAVRYHTLGHPEMGLVAQIIYAADFIEDGRSFEGLKEIQKIVKENLMEGIYLISSNSIKYQLKLDNPIHPYTNNLRNKFLLKRSDN
ncbi:MAG: bis(5'-nucleosyl)-tetraphosphatase (symmetrical) YqeK [Halanaerobium sp.]